MCELASFGHGLAEKPMIVVASKIDVANPEKLKKLKAMAKRKKLPFYEISAVTSAGIEALKYAIGERVRELREADTGGVELAAQTP
jgi:GTPase